MAPLELQISTFLLGKERRRKRRKRKKRKGVCLVAMVMRCRNGMTMSLYRQKHSGRGTRYKIGKYR